MSEKQNNDRLVAELLDTVIDMAEQQRLDFLNANCENPEIIKQVLALVASELDAERILAEPLHTAAGIDFAKLTLPDEAASEPDYKVIGHFKIERLLGEGGMGRVFLARQSEPVNRVVALKLMKHALASNSDQARFDAERQSLARLNHPNIALMFEAGATEEGKPYFAMELVDGIAVTRYCDENELTIKQRLALFRAVCLGVHHAHQKQVLHRDLKPSNILVTSIDGKPVPKVIDFGVALGLDENASTTDQNSQRVGTPGYACPESLNTEPDASGLDTRSDIYTLGIVLYELLCGTRPFDRPGDAILEVWRKIREQDALPPSAQLGEQSKQDAAKTARNRSISKSELTKSLKGDLDAVVLKAIAKDPADRYGSISSLVSDIDAHLEHRPVSARPQDLTYVAGRFVTRNLGLVTAATLLSLAMIIGLAAWWNEAIRANKEADRANREAAIALNALSQSRDLSTFLSRLFHLPSTGDGNAERLSIRELLDAGKTELESMEEITDLERARLMQALGVIYTDAFVLDQAEDMLRQALEIRERKLGMTHTDVAETLASLGNVQSTQMNFEGAEALLRRAMRIAASAKPRDAVILAQVWDNLGRLYSEQGMVPESIQAYQNSIAIRRSELADKQGFSLAVSMNDLGVMLMSQGRYREAEPLLEKAADAYRTQLGTQNLRTAATVNNLAQTKENLGSLQQAEDNYRLALEYWIQTEGELSRRALMAAENLARVLGRWGRVEEGIEQAQFALTKRQQANPPLHPDLTPALVTLAVNLGLDEQYDEATVVLNQALEINLKAFGPDHRRTLAVMDSKGWLHWRQGNYEESCGIHEELLQGRLSARGPLHAITAFSQHNAALCEAAMGQLNLAQELMRAALETRLKLYGESHRATAQTQHYLGLIEWNLGNIDEASGLLQSALATRTILFPENHPDVQRSQQATRAVSEGEAPLSVTPNH